MYSPTNVPILHKMRKQILKRAWNLKRSWRNKAILREKTTTTKKQFRFQKILQSYCNKNNMVLVPKQTPMDEQNSKSKHNCT